MDTIFEKRSTDKTCKDRVDDNKSIDIALNRKIFKTNVDRKYIKPRVSIRRDLVGRDAMGRKQNELKKPITNQAKSMPGSANYSVKYSALYPNVSVPVMVEPLNLIKKYEKKWYPPFYNVREQLVWHSRGFTFKGRDFRKEIISPFPGPADYYVKEFPKKISPSLKGRSKSAVVLLNSPGPIYNTDRKEKGAAFSITGKRRELKCKKDFPSPAHYEQTRKNFIPGGVLSNRHNNKIFGENHSPGPIYKPNVFIPTKAPTIKGRYKSPYTHLSCSPGPQSYFVTYHKNERGPSFSLTPKPFPETSKDKYPGPANYSRQVHNKKKLDPTLKGKFIESKLSNIKPGPADYNIKQRDQGCSAIVNKRLEIIDNRYSNPSPSSYDIDRMSNSAPAYSFGLRWSQRKKLDKSPGPASYFPKQRTSKKVSIKGKRKKDLSVSNCSPGPIYYPKDFNCSKNITGISLSSRHSPWVYSPIKRY